MKKDLELLYSLQFQDDQLKEIEDLIKEIPLRIKSLEDERDSKIYMIETTKKKLDENRKNREKLEKEILLIKEKIKKYQDQMLKATTNKEYQGFTAEIKFERDNISQVEEHIIEKMLESDEIMNELRGNESAFNLIADSYNQQITELKGHAEFNRKKFSEQEQKRAELRKTIPQNLLRIYDNLFKNKGKKAVSFVETDFCGVCNVKIRPQIMSILISTDTMILCESCGRILYKKVIEEKDSDISN